MAEYVMFIDESGDHNLKTVDAHFPMFCLCGIIFADDYYHAVARPLVDDFKLRFWGRTDVILHSREIRRQEGPFGFLVDAERRAEFYEAVNQMMGSLSFTLLTVAILKREHVAMYGLNAQHPYHLGLGFIMERFAMTMRQYGRGHSGHILAESRGETEDQMLLKEFFRLKDSGSQYMTFDDITTFWTEKKQKNIAGLQIADLAAYPLARKILDPAGAQSSFDVLRPKICCSPKDGRMLGYGIKVFPQATFEHYVYLDGG